MARRKGERVPLEEAGPVNPILGELLREKGFAPSEPAPEPPAEPAGEALLDLSRAGKVVVARERKGRGGKTVTVVRGLPAGGLERLAREMRKALGCGAAVDGSSLVLQGDLTQRACAWLAGRGATRVVVGN